MNSSDIANKRLKRGGRNNKEGGGKSAHITVGAFPGSARMCIKLILAI